MYKVDMYIYSDMWDDVEEMAQYNLKQNSVYIYIYRYIHTQYNHIVNKKVNEYYYFISTYLFTSVFEVHKSTFLDLTSCGFIYPYICIWRNTQLYSYPC